MRSRSLDAAIAQPSTRVPCGHSCERQHEPSPAAVEGVRHPLPRDAASRLVLMLACGVLVTAHGGVHCGGHIGRSNPAEWTLRLSVASSGVDTLAARIQRSGHSELWWRWLRCVERRAFRLVTTALQTSQCSWRAISFRPTTNARGACLDHGERCSSHATARGCGHRRVMRQLERKEYAALSAL